MKLIPIIIILLFLGIFLEKGKNAKWRKRRFYAYLILGIATVLFLGYTAGTVLGNLSFEIQVAFVLGIFFFIMLIINALKRDK